LRGGKRSVPPLKPAFFHEKESSAKKANCRAAPLSRLDRRFFGKKAWQKTQLSNIRGVFLFDALRGMFNTRVRGGCRRARSPHANELCEHFHASKADATNVARMSGGRAISRERPERVPTALAPGAQAQ